MLGVMLGVIPGVILGAIPGAMDAAVRSIAPGVTRVCAPGATRTPNARRNTSTYAAGARSAGCGYIAGIMSRPIASANSADMSIEVAAAMFAPLASGSAGRNP